MNPLALHYAYSVRHVAVCNVALDLIIPLAHNCAKFESYHSRFISGPKAEMVRSDKNRFEMLLNVDVSSEEGWAPAGEHVLGD